MLVQFTHSQDMQGHISHESLTSDILNHLQSLPQDNFPHFFNQHLQTLQRSITNYNNEFKQFIRRQAQKDDTWRF